MERRVERRIAQCHRFFERVHAQPIDMRCERARDRHQTVTVRVRFDDGRQAGRRDQRRERARVADDRVEIDREFGDHAAAGRASTRETTSATGIPKNSMCAISSFSSRCGDGR